MRNTWIDVADGFSTFLARAIAFAFVISIFNFFIDIGVEYKNVAYWCAGAFVAMFICEFFINKWKEKQNEKGIVFYVRNKRFEPETK